MKNIGRRLFLISFIFALISATAIYFYLVSLDETKEVVEISKTTILVAAIDIEPRTIIEKDMIKEIEIIKENEYGNFINVHDELLGLYTKEKIYANERFHDELLIKDTNNELSLKIKGDRRAVSVLTTLDAGVANLLKTGDFVDVFVSMPELKSGEDLVRPETAKLVLQDIEVLAIDQNLDRKPKVYDQQPNSFIVTMSVPILDIEGLILAENIGRVKLALRPIDNDYIYDTKGAIWEEFFIDDYGRLKDLFPVYEVEIADTDTIIVSADKYTYDKYYHYTIKYGDTLKTISKEYYGSEDKYELLKQINRIEDEDTILAGSNIKIPVLNEEDLD